MAENPNPLLFSVEILESSSSSDEEELELLLSSKNPRPKIENYRDVINKYTDEEFRRNFRVTRQTFTILLELFNDWEVQKNLHGGYRSTTNDIQVLSFLWFARNKCVIRDVASRFGIAESTFHRTSNNVVQFLKDIAPRFIKLPHTVQEKREIARKFQDISGFPGVIGAIDGTYIPIRTPTHKIKSTYTNRHDQPSITLQAVCDSNKAFLDVFTGPPSKIHDARIFKLSFLSNKLADVCGNEWHLVGDVAYPLCAQLITPYRDYGNLTPEERNFNYKLSATRVKIENAFGLFKQRFRQLQRTEFLSVFAITKFIIACCVLHNLCIFHHDEWNEYEDLDFNDAQIQFPEPIEYNADARAAGVQKRDRLCAQFDRN